MGSLRRPRRLCWNGRLSRPSESEDRRRFGFGVERFDAALICGYCPELIESTLMVFPSRLPMIFTRGPASPSSSLPLPAKSYFLSPSTSTYLEPFRTHIFVHSVVLLPESMSCLAPQRSSVIKPAKALLALLDF